jgi:hypothetical protein
MQNIRPVKSYELLGGQRREEKTRQPVTAGEQ